MTDATPYEVLARKYRPGKLSELIGQDVLVQTLTHAIEQDRIPHAFIMTGIRGVGKTSTARIIAKSLLSTGKEGTQERPTAEPCGVCEHCRSIAEDRHVDVLEMDAASRTGVNDIREIIENVRYAPVSGRYKIYIIDEVHMLSKSAFNALLKTLEEPPAHSKFIFATTEIRKIPVTILSRCMRFDLPRVGVDLLSKHFASVAEREGATLDDYALMLIANAAEGSVRDGLSLLDQVISSHTGEEMITAEEVARQLGFSNRSGGFKVIEALGNADAKAAIIALRALYQQGADPLNILMELSEIVHIITQHKVLEKDHQLSHLPETEQAEVINHAKQLTIPQLSRMWQMLQKGIQEAQYSYNSMAAAEMILVRIAYAGNLPTPGDLVKKLQDDTTRQATQPVSGRNSAATAELTSARAIEISAVKNVSESEPVSENVPVQSPGDFESLVELFSQQGEYLLYEQLQEVRLVKFDKASHHLEIQPTASTPKELSGKIAHFLRQWTNEQWIVIVSNKEGQTSLREQRASEFEKRKKAALESEEVRAILAAFPGATILATRDIQGEPTTDEIQQEQPNAQTTQEKR